MTIKNFSKDTILCDADFLIAFLLENDSNHIEAVEILNANIEADFVYLNLTEYELLTVLSRKLEQRIATAIYDSFKDTFSIRIEFDISLESTVIQFYKNAKNKNQSFFDIACLTLAQKNNWRIASFDKFYPKNILAAV